MAQYKVVDNTPITLPSAAGGFTDGRKITAELPDGTRIVVKIPAGADWADKANTAICAQIDEINKLHQLGQ